MSLLTDARLDAAQIHLASELDSKAFTLILEKIEGGIAVLDGQAKVIVWNKWLAKTSGISPKDAQGKSLEELFPNLSDTRLFDCIEQCMTQGMASYLSPSLHRDLFPLCRDTSGQNTRELIKQLVYIKPIDYKSCHKGCFIQIVDVTTAINRDNAMRRQAERLEQSNLDLSQFAYVASHDLQEPLRTIRGFGDILLQNYKEALPAEGQDFLNRIVKGADRLQTMISDLLVFSKISEQKSHYTKLDLNDVCHAVLEQLEAVMHETKAVCSIDTLPEVYGEKSQLMRLFQNLLSNSLKFFDGKRSPQIRIYTEPTLPADIYGDDVRKYVTICVRDNGIGFDQVYANSIFKAFERLHSRSRYAGNGLGLAICRRIVERHNGYISAHGEPDQGAVFRVTLPIIKTE